MIRCFLYDFARGWGCFLRMAALDCWRLCWGCVWAIGLVFAIGAALESGLGSGFKFFKGDGF
jgi:hypothetical protein